MLLKIMNPTWYDKVSESTRVAITTLNEQQLFALADIIEWYLNSNENHYKLTGYAGTGKTYLIAIILKALLELEDLSICGIAPSHKAKRQLKRSIESQRIFEIEYFSISSFLGKAPVLNESNGSESFEQVDKGSMIYFSNIEKYDLIVCDEYGMVSMDDAVQLLRSSEVKILFLGDSAQLPPVNETSSYVDDCKSMRESLLTEIVRFSGELLTVANSYNIKNNLKPIRLTGSSMDGSIVHLSSKKKLIELYCAKLANTLDSSKTEYQNWDFAKFICYTNKSCETVNDWVREKLFGEDSESPYLPNERLIAIKPLFRQASAELNYKYLLHTEGSTEFTVIELVAINDTCIGESDYKYYSVKVQPDEGREFCLRVIHPDYISLLNLEQSKAKKKRLETFSSFNENIRYCHSQLCDHLLQSSREYLQLCFCWC